MPQYDSEEFVLMKRPVEAFDAPDEANKSNSEEENESGRFLTRYDFYKNSPLVCFCK